MQNDIDALKKEEDTIKKKLFSLSVYGSVFIPSLAFIISLLSSLFGLIAYPINTENYLIVSSLSIVGGSYFIFQTLSTIGWASLRVALPKFGITFDDYQQEVKINVNEKRTMVFGLDNTGDLLAEKVRILMFFPPEFKIYRSADYEIVTQSESDEEFPNYVTADLVFELAHIGICNLFEIVVRAPKKPDKYLIPVRIFEKNVPETNLEVTINVIE